MVHQNAFRTVFSQQTIGLEYFADSSDIPLNPPTNYHPDLIATTQQMSLLQFCVLLSQQSHLFLNGEELMCNDSTIDLHRLCQISRNCQCKCLWVDWSAPGTFASSSGFLVKSCFCTDTPGSIGWPSLAPLLHTGDCFEIHILH